MSHRSIAFVLLGCIAITVSPVRAHDSGTPPSASTPRTLKPLMGINPALLMPKANTQQATDEQCLPIVAECYGKAMKGATIPESAVISPGSLQSCIVQKNSGCGNWLYGKCTATDKNGAEKDDQIFVTKIPLTNSHLGSQTFSVYVKCPQEPGFNAATPLLTYCKSLEMPYGSEGAIFAPAIPAQITLCGSDFLLHTFSVAEVFWAEGAQCMIKGQNSTATLPGDLNGDGKDEVFATFDWQKTCRTLVDLGYPGPETELCLTAVTSPTPPIPLYDPAGGISSLPFPSATTCTLYYKRQ